MLPPNRKQSLPGIAVRAVIETGRRRLSKVSFVQIRKNFLNALWLFFPSVLFLLIGYFIFWHLTQGKDLMVITLEDPKSKTAFAEVFIFIVALVFWIYVTWFSTRLVARAKSFMFPEQENDNGWRAYLIHTPRLLAFSCISIILIAFLQLDEAGSFKINEVESHIAFIVSIFFYFVIYDLWSVYLTRHKEKRNTSQWKDFLKNTRFAFFFLLIWIGLMVMWLKSFGTIILLLVAMQIILVLLMLIRKELDLLAGEGKASANTTTPHSNILKRITFLIWHDENKRYVTVLIIIAVIALIPYLLAIHFVEVAVYIGPFPFILLAFGVLLGFGNMLTFLSVVWRTNLHLILFFVALYFGSKYDSHKLHLPDHQAGLPIFSERQDLREYLSHWLNNPERKRQILQGNSKYPVYFVMSNGGASRSGYWTARILSSLEDASERKFSKHLFCLSGASGGSVGNATFFSLLRARKDLERKGICMTDAAGNYLQSDFLTYTISHLFGPDIFRNIFPFINSIGRDEDRGRALASSLEEASGSNSFLYDSLAAPFSSLITRKNDTAYQLPVLCINATSMRDGNPAVFSNINIRGGPLAPGNYFNKRIDILELIGDHRDIKLSTAVVLGASFPYISPAGRIDSLHDVNGKLTEKGSQYFVDGGYFDNSGAGFVNEMIIGINNLLATDDSLKIFKDHLEFFVLHILNTDPKNRTGKPINSMTNDLLAPFKTMLGSYGKQTTVNDERLKSYLRSIYTPQVDDHYLQIDLYDDARFRDPQYKFRYSMNWVISNRQLNKMNEALFCNEVYRSEVKKMMTWKY
jgi:hypothetical protein